MRKCGNTSSFFENILEIFNQMKKTHLLIAVNLIFTVAAFSYFFLGTAEKVAYVDSNSLLSGYQGMIDARADFQKMSAEWQARIDTLTVDVQNELKRHEKEVAKMTKKEKGLSEQLIRSKQQQLVTYQKAIQEKAAQEDARITQAVIDDMNAYIQDYGKQKSYKIIFAATNVGNILYAQEGVNITEEVVAGLNIKYRGE